ncbi:MAG: binding-protein-dependent transport system inner rane component, partial [Chloroflexi bacterium]|nr:binding-protein-dependent transport system inner rane component [Chloroflexota bacterium]
RPGPSARSGGSGIRWTIRRLLATPQGLVGTALLALELLIVILGPFLAPYNPDGIGAAPVQGSSAAHLLGTDTYGRDVLSRVLVGGGSVIVLPLLAVITSVLIGSIVGLVSGYLRGRFDAVVTWVLDVALAVPTYLSVIVIIAGFGTGQVVVVTAVAAVYAPYIARVLRAATQAIAPRDYILAARARGESLRFILFREILPNIVPTLLVEIALRLTYAVIFIASLSYLGLGVQPPSANWGVMVAENRLLLLIHPIVVIAPTILIGLLAVAINLIADALTIVFGDQITERIML